MSEFRFFSFTDFQYRANDSTLFTLPITLSTKSTPSDSNEMSDDLNVPYMVFEILVAIFAVVGNLMVIVVFQRERKLRRRTNYYIVSLAIADFLVGSLGVPFAILASIGLPRDLYTCLFTVSLLVVLCTISIFCLVAVSVDRYWAILYPMAYSRNVRTRTAIVIISMCWVAGTIVGFLPLFGWHVKPENEAEMSCHFVKVMDYNYLVFLYFATIITPALLMLAFYTHIYRVIVKQVRQIVTMNPMSDSSRRNSNTQIHMTPGRQSHGGTMLRVLGASRKRDVKATQNLSIIVLFFMICWFPLYTINCIKAFCPDCQVSGKLTLFSIILSHLNSAGNPVLYAYHLKDFRLALKNLLLKIMGIEVEQPVDPMHRFSLASQHRLQSIDASMRHSLQPRIYIDSPIWLRQQQQSLKSSQLAPKCGVITPCLNNIHHTVAAVASVPTDIGRNMWNIMEASSGAELEDVNYEFPIDRSSNTPPTPVSHTLRRASSLDHCDSTAYSYNNCNYNVSPDESELDEVFLPNMQNNSGTNSVESVRLNGQLKHTQRNEKIAGEMREKLRSDDMDYQSQVMSNQRVLTDSSYSDYDIQKQSAGHTPPARTRLLTTVQQRRLPHSEAVNISKTTTAATSGAADDNDSADVIGVSIVGSLSRSTSSLSGLSNTGVYVVENDTNPLSPRRKRKFRKAQRLPMNFNKSLVAAKNTSSRRSFSEYGEASAKVKAPDTPANIHSNTVNNGNIAQHQHQQQSALNGCNIRPPINNNSSNNNKNNNSNHKLNCNATERLQQPHTIHGHQHDMFSPLRAVSHLIFPPIVKHSSLFQLFQPSVSSGHASTAHVASATEVPSQATATSAVTGATTTTPTTTNAITTSSSMSTTTASTTTTTPSDQETQYSPHSTAASRIASLDESILTTVTDLTEPTPTPQSKAQPPPSAIDTRLG
uniref:Adenosine receptor A2a n=1 Tax=Ceratitis capitata TaxID=7213 RepID=W8C370_CERCA